MPVDFLAKVLADQAQVYTQVCVLLEFTKRASAVWYFHAVRTCGHAEKLRRQL